MALSRMQINSHRRAISRCGCAAKLEETLSDQITWRWKLPWPWTKRTSWKRSKHWHLAGSFNAKRSVFHLRKKGGWLTRSELGPLKGSYGEIVPVPRVKAGSPSLHDGSRCRSWYCTKDYSGVWRAVLASSLKSEQGVEGTRKWLAALEELAENKIWTSILAHASLLVASVRINNC